jgi:membrane-associated phospholipid phosphatase
LDYCMSVVGQVEAEAPRLGAVVVRRVVMNLITWIWSAISPRRIRAAQPRPAWARPGRLLLGATAIVLLIAFAMLFLDAWAITQQRTLGRWVVVTFENITDLGRSGWLLGPLGIIVATLAAISSPALGRMGQGFAASLVARVGYVFVAVGLPGLIVTIVKRLIGRARPYAWETGGPLNFEPFRWSSEFASLPSGHGTTAFATAFAIGALYQRLRLPLWTLAVVIAASRVAVSAHYPSDVLAGALVGALGALVVRNWFAVRRLAFVVAPDRSVRPLPGPSLRRLRAFGRRIVGR